MKFILLLLLLSLMPSFQLFAQETGIDSFTIKANLVKKTSGTFTYQNKIGKPIENNILNQHLIISNLIKVTLKTQQCLQILFM